MKKINLRCPNCNADNEIKIEGGQKYLFCPYCGQKYLLDDNKISVEINKNINYKKTTEHINRKINDAEVIKAKNEAYRLKMKQKQREEENERRSNFAMLTVLVIMMVIVFVMAIFIGLQESLENLGKDKDAYTSPLESSFSYLRDDYEEVVKSLELAGFENIETVDLNDASFFKKENTVSSISINGVDDFSTDDEFPKDAKIVIYYH